MKTTEERVTEILEVITRQPSQLWKPMITEVVQEAERDVRVAVRNYCRMAQSIAEEAPDNPHAVGLARGYQDVADKLSDALERVAST